MVKLSTYMSVGVWTLVVSNLCCEFQITNVLAKPDRVAHFDTDEAQDEGDAVGNDANDFDYIDEDLDDAESRSEELDTELDEANDLGLKEEIAEETEESEFAKAHAATSETSSPGGREVELLRLAEELRDVNQSLKEL